MRRGVMDKCLADRIASNILDILAKTDRPMSFDTILWDMDAAFYWRDVLTVLLALVKGGVVRRRRDGRLNTYRLRRRAPI